MTNLLAGSSRYVSTMGGTDEVGRRTVQILRLLEDGVHPVVWQVCFDSEKAAADLYKWIRSKTESWELWGRIALRLGADAAHSLSLTAALTEERERKAAERERRRQEDEDRRLAQTIDLYLFTPAGKRPYLGLERGSDSTPFFIMKFDEKWERDRVSDWLAYNKQHFAEMERMFHELGQLALERHILDGMRATEKHVKSRGEADRGRRPLRFWRGE
jgi:hypothetical protein